MTQSAITITLEEGLRFSRLSGDFNPLHVNPIAARRSLFGTTTVHGIHAVLRGLDTYFAGRSGRWQLTSLKVWYPGAIDHGQAVRYEFTESAPGHLRCVIIANEQEVTTFEAQLASGDVAGAGLPDSGAHQPADPQPLSFEEAQQATGAVPLLLDEQLCEGLFPHARRCLPPVQLAELAAATRVVGMKCPGLNSLCSKLTLKACSPAKSQQEMAYRVRRASRPLSLLVVVLEGSSLSGEMETIYRPSPVRQPSYATVCEAVTDREFAGQRALVIGGSRGLGEVAVKLIAAGGGSVVNTYCVGRDDGLHVAAEITAGGGDCRTWQFDVLEPPGKLPADLPADWRPTHVYYFATPFIRLGKSSGWNAGQFERFCECYVTGFQRTLASVRSLWQLGDAPLAVYYPSTELLNQAGTIAVEYQVAKFAGEALCRVLQAESPGTRITSTRLPRILTDNTNALLAPAGADPVAMLLSFALQAAF
jgi:acyl dehydratase